MRHSALGLVEVRGYLGAVAVADAALKAASVTCIGVEIINGGLVTVKLDGDVGAVQAAVEAGAEMATQLDVLVTRHVIARMHEETAALVASPVDTDGSQGQLEECAARSQEQQEVTAKVTERASKEVTEKVSKEILVSVEDIAERAVGIEVVAASAVTESAASGSISNAEVKKAAAATKEVDEVKPTSGQTGTVPAAVTTAATAEKTTSVQKNQGNDNNSRVKPVPAPAAKRSKKTKKASS
ncbi:BMC domain-containing protein [Paenibacillus sp. OSY-SE]|uniref:BMC domain-containing protein n=1 Tax=Paenibacillus sp. OSY-SE TaxID=1196323 RepID=UPI0003186B17|nr:BMC domain-containing protein [Paenibacillus sp. OSY-SE]